VGSNASADGVESTGEIVGVIDCVGSNGSMATSDEWRQLDTRVINSRIQDIIADFLFIRFILMAHMRNANDNP
jgi:hypothetical protein